MRVWDVHPGSLNRQSLLGEHRELHGILSILTTGQTGYVRRPETLRWKRHLWTARQRHRLLVAEMTLRGYAHHVSEGAGPKPDEPGALLALITRRAPQLGESYLLRSTTLSDFTLWVDGAKASR